MIYDTFKRTAAALCCLLTAFISSWGCTSAIISASANPSGRPLLWKHRDTSKVDNKVEYVAPRNGDMGYVALFNADDRRLEQAWMGMNDAGFAVMNTASYNIKDDSVPERQMDREGYVMTIALRSCRTIEDFARLLESLPRPMGVEANFGAIDATGAGAYFETNNHTYVRYDLESAPDGVLVRTNYSHSGRPDEGFGFVRECNAETLLAPYIAESAVTPCVLTETVSRSFYHSLTGHDYAQELCMGRWVVDQDFIPRYKSTATIVIEGCRPLDDASRVTPEFVASQYIMWTGMGYPPCSEILPVWCRAGGVADELRGIGPEGRSPMCDLVKERRAEVFPIHRDNGDKYIDMQRLVNSDGTGYIQVLSPRNTETYARIADLRDKREEEDRQYLRP